MTSQSGHDVPPDALAFYRDVLRALNRASLPYLVGGSYALHYYTRITRHSKDFDIFIARADYERISQVLSAAGYDTELTYPHWLAKVRCSVDTIDLVFNSGNGVAEVDQEWFDHAASTEIFGIPAHICPAEETIWSKAYVMERERFDGADVAHLILAQGQQLDWPRLLRRFGPHWRLLLSHLILFGFIYPAHRHAVPSWIMDELLDRLNEEDHTSSPDKNGCENNACENSVCNGTLLSRAQYLSDVHELGYRDARVTPQGNMTEHEAAQWTEAIKDK